MWSLQPFSVHSVSHVTILEREAHLLGPMDSEVSQALEEELKQRGITIHCQVNVKEIKEDTRPWSFLRF